MENEKEGFRTRKCCPMCNSFNYIKTREKSEFKSNSLKKVKIAYICRNCNHVFTVHGKVDAICESKITKSAAAQFKIKKHPCPTCGNLDHKRCHTFGDILFKCNSCKTMFKASELEKKHSEGLIV